MLARIIVVGGLAVASLGGCVSQGTHDDLKRRYDHAQATLETREATLAQLRQQHDEAKTRIAALDVERATLTERVAALQREAEAHETEISRLRGEQARLTEEQTRLNNELAATVKDRSRLRESTARLQEALADLSRRKAEAERRVSEFRELLARFKALIDAGTLSVKIIEGRMVIALPSDVLFDSGSATLSTAGRAAVREVSTVLASMDNRRFQVEGHTDDVPIHTPAYASNWELSTARALGVVKAMVDAGVEPTHVSAAGLGEFHPVAGNDTPEGRTQNRRIEIVMLPDLSMLPGFDELSRVVAQP